MTPTDVLLLIIAAQLSLIIINVIYKIIVKRLRVNKPIKATDIIDKNVFKIMKDLEKDLKSCVDLMNKLNSTVKESDNINIA